MAECALCSKTTKKWNFPCRDEETGQMAEIEYICKDCHDVWCCCSCKRTRGLKFGDTHKLMEIEC